MGKRLKETRSIQKWVQVMNSNGCQVVDFDLAEDVKALLLNNPDVKCEPKLKTTVFSYDDMEMLKVVKEISSPMKIVAVEKVTADKF